MPWPNLAAALVDVVPALRGVLLLALAVLAVHMAGLVTVAAVTTVPAALEVPAVMAAVMAAITVTVAVIVATTNAA